jgi:hypothetical protein
MFAACRKLEGPEDRPESERWELLLLEEHKDRPESIFYLGGLISRLADQQ